MSDIKLRAAVKYASQGNISKFGDSVDSILKDRYNDAIDRKRVEIASNLFNDDVDVEEDFDTGDDDAKIEELSFSNEVSKEIFAESINADISKMAGGDIDSELAKLSTKQLEKMWTGVVKKFHGKYALIGIVKGRQQMVKMVDDIDVAKKLAKEKNYTVMAIDKRMSKGYLNVNI